MKNNDILRRLRYVFNFNDTKMIAIFHQGDLPVNREQVSAWLKKDDAEDFEIGDEIGIPLDVHPQELGRIAAQAAKQHIIQQVRNAEREIIYNEFKDRKGELIAGIVRRFEKGVKET